MEGLQMSAQHSSDDLDERIDTFVADPDVARELDVSLMTIWRWDQTPELAVAGWPPKIQIRKRNFRSRRQLEEFKKAMLKKAIAERKRSDVGGERCEREHDHA
jgi:hypothetical protein